MRTGEQHDPDGFPDLSLPERPGEVPAPPAPPSNPHIKVQTTEEAIWTAADVDDMPLRSIALTAGSSAPGHPSVLVRVNAGLLALLGMMWCLYLLPDMRGAGPFELLTMGPFYLLTAGYLMRAVSRPQLAMRRLFWVLSILVHGAWLAFAVWLAATGPITMEADVAMAWWALSVGLSIWSLRRERPDYLPSSQPKSRASQERIVIGILSFLLVIAAAMAVVFYLVRLR